MIIQNFETLALTPLRKQALLIAEAGLSGIATPTLVKQHFRYTERTQVLHVRGRKFDIAGYKRVIVVGFGTTALQAVTAIQEILGSRISCGFVIDVEEGTLDNNIVCKVGTHPTPSMVNVSATKELVAMLQQNTVEDLVICVVSGGGSSLLCYPTDMTCEDQNSLVTAMSTAGASINEINTVRKHLSQVKGGNLAKICYPATVISLIFSNVPADDLGMVASGPTVKDDTTIQDAAAILQKYNVLELCKLPSCNLVETPKEDKYFEKVKNVLFVSAKDALLAMQQKADDLGFTVKIWNPAFQGEAAELGLQIVQASQPGECVLGAGESTVTRLGSPDGGVGGRNQEMALTALPFLKDNQILVTVASDGTDNMPAAGAIADLLVRQQAEQLQLAPPTFLANHDSGSFFEQVNGQLQTGNTGSNVSDLFVCLEQ